MTEQEAKESLWGFGDRLDSLIRKSGMTRREFAERCGISYNTINYMAHGDRYPTLWSLIRIREALGCTWGDLMEGGVCHVKVAHPDMGGFHEYVCGAMRMQFKYRGDLNYCPVCGRRADVRS